MTDWHTAPAVIRALDAFNVKFMGHDGNLLGHLREEDGKLVFEGDADASAQEFIRCVQYYWARSDG